MELTAKELTGLKAVELEMLKLFIDICAQLKLRYYMLGGTLLGAVRHKGFIPWDDDIDVGMPREDYEIFLQRAQALMPEKYFLQTFETDPEWPANFAKIRDSETTFVETSVRNCKINHGVYVDIFPLDYYPDAPKQRKIFKIKNKLFVSRIANEFYFSSTPSIKKCAGLLVAKLLYPSLTKTLRRREKMFKSVRDGKFIVNHCGAWGAKEIVPAAWYGDGCFLEFEGLRVCAPVEYDKWLTQVYGDYMQFPPPEKRKAHHYNDAVDLGRSYREYCK